MISIITPSFNIYNDGRKEWFIKMLESVRNQTYNDIEHIVIDGDSKDETPDLLKFYKNKGFIDKLIIEKDKGIYDAMNKGIKISTGDYIIIMNTDDYFTDNNFFKKSLEILENNKDIDFTHGDKIIKSRDGKADSIKKGDEKSAFFRMPFRHQTMIVRKKLFDEIGLFDENLEIASDYKFVLKILLKGKKGYYIPEIFVCALDGGASSNRRKCIEEVSKIIYETYGEIHGLTIEECTNIYLRKISQELMNKIQKNIKDKSILESLQYAFNSVIL